VHSQFDNPFSPLDRLILFVFFDITELPLVLEVESVRESITLTAAVSRQVF